MNQIEVPKDFLDIEPLPAALNMQRGGARTSSSLGKPFLKWAGGKRKLIPELLRRVSEGGNYRRYHEPFLGGGALFFALSGKGANTRGARLSDSNVDLIETYTCVRDAVDDVIAVLQGLAERHNETFFYETRESVPTDVVERVARFIYLNKTGYNGLYRVNRAGKFNVPFGRYANPTICDESRLRVCSEAIQETELAVADFETVLKYAAPGDWVYFDPPYAPLSPTASFTNYTPGGFGPAEQERLAHVFRELTARGVKAILSNSATHDVQALYDGFTIQTVHAPRAINSRANGRGSVSELIIKNF